MVLAVRVIKISKFLVYDVPLNQSQDVDQTENWNQT